MKRIKLSVLVLLAGLLNANAVFAGEVDPANVPAPKQTIAKKYLSAKEAAALKQSMGNKALLVDIRTQAEITFVGKADAVDANIPYMLANFSTWDDKKGRFLLTQNATFTDKMDALVSKAGLNKESTIIVMCRSGDRSARAADELTKAGYSNVYSVVEGFEGDVAKEGPNAGKRTVNGWKNAGLPWSYKVEKDKMYLD